MKLLALPIVVLIGLATAAPECSANKTAVPGTNKQVPGTDLQVPGPEEILSEDMTIEFIKKAEKGKSFVCNEVAEGKDTVECGLMNQSSVTKNRTVQKQLKPICKQQKGCFDCRFASDPKDWKVLYEKSTTGVFEVFCKLREKKQEQA